MQIVELLQIFRRLASFFATGREVLPGHRRPGALVGRQIVLGNARFPGRAVIPQDRGHDLIGRLALVIQAPVNAQRIQFDANAHRFQLFLEQLGNRVELHRRFRVGDTEDKGVAIQIQTEIIGVELGQAGLVQQLLGQFWVMFGGV